MLFDISAFCLLRWVSSVNRGPLTWDKTFLPAVCESLPWNVRGESSGLCCSPLCNILRWCCLMRILKSCTSVFRKRRNFRVSERSPSVKNQGRNHVSDTWRKWVSQQGGCAWGLYGWQKKNRESVFLLNLIMGARTHPINGASKSRPFEMLCNRTLRQLDRFKRPPNKIHIVQRHAQSGRRPSQGP